MQPLMTATSQVLKVQWASHLAAREPYKENEKRKLKMGYRVKLSSTKQVEVTGVFLKKNLMRSATLAADKPNHWQT